MNMSFSKFLLSVLAVTLVAGQIPYGYLYCTLMKRPLDSNMLHCCKARQSDRSPSIEGSSKFQVRHIEKKTTDGFDHRPGVHAAVGQYVQASQDCPMAARFLIRQPANLPSPDIVLDQRNLRI